MAGCRKCPFYRDYGEGTNFQKNGFGFCKADANPTFSDDGKSVHPFKINPNSLSFCEVMENDKKQRVQDKSRAPGKTVADVPSEIEGDIQEQIQEQEKETEKEAV